jgi:hypothetical protein
MCFYVSKALQGRTINGFAGKEKQGPSAGSCFPGNHVFMKMQLLIVLASVAGMLNGREKDQPMNPVDSGSDRLWFLF